MIKHLFSIFIACGAIITPAFAERESKTDRALVQRIERYINNMTTLAGDFSQAGPGAQKARGRFWISRPGRMRFAYQAGMVVLADGVWLAVQQKKQSRPERYPLNATPARFLLQSRLNLRRVADVEKIENTRQRIALWLRLKDKNLPGKMYLRFRKNPLALTGWTILDAQGEKTKIDLYNVQRGVDLDPRLFFIEEKSIFKKR